MDTAIQLSPATQPIQPSRAQRRPPWWPESGIGRLFFVAAAVVLAVVALYGEENWRGKRSWEVCKTMVESKGGLLDWAAFIPRAVPDDQNFFAAPKMTAWFVGRGGNELSGKLDVRNFDRFWQSHTSSVVAEVTVIGPSDSVTGPSDLVLDYTAPILALGSPDYQGKGDGKASLGLRDTVLTKPVVFDGVPLEQAIKTLAASAGLAYQLDLGAIPQPAAKQPTVKGRWINVTAKQALLSVLDSHNLKWLADSKSGVARIARKTANDHRIQTELPAEEKIRQLLQSVVAAATNGDPGLTIMGAQAFPIVVNPAKPTQPIRVFVRAAADPTSQDFADFFNANGLPCHLVVESTGSNSFRLILTDPLRVTAADYLAWSDQFEPDFEAIDQALKRPYALMAGNYERPVDMPIPNFICVRVVSQTLAQRAQSRLLLGQPEQALHDVTLMHDLARLLEGRSAGFVEKPMTLVAAMINVAITGLYVNTVEDGLRLQVWRDADLATIQRQLQDVNLVPFVTSALETERASVCHIFETISAGEFRKLSSNRSAPSIADLLKDPSYLFVKLAPRGWIYQNMTKVALLESKAVDSFDSRRGLVRPSIADDAMKDVEAAFKTHSPFTFLAAWAIPNFSRAFQTCAHNQTLVNELQIVCALERYQMIHHEYPATLAGLGAELLGKLPVDIIGGGALAYRPTPDGKFILYSIGWNEHDDGGLRVDSKNSAVDIAKGDWVWPYREQMMR